MAIRQFTDIAHRIVWCTMATVDPQGRPRSRVVHPVWEQTGADLTGWVVSRRTPLKVAHLRHSAFASCSYWDPQHDVAVAECAAHWLTDPAERARVWSYLTSLPPPLGWDPSSIFPGGPGDDSAGILRLTPWRLSSRLAPDFAAGRPPTVWRSTEKPTPIPGLAPSIDDHLPVLTGAAGGSAATSTRES